MIKHYRFYCKEKNNWYIMPKGGMTVISSYSSCDNNIFVKISISLCSPDDIFCKKLGIDYALVDPYLEKSYQFSADQFQTFNFNSWLHSEILSILQRRVLFSAWFYKCASMLASKRYCLCSGHPNSGDIIKLKFT